MSLCGLTHGKSESNGIIRDALSTGVLRVSVCRSNLSIYDRLGRIGTPFKVKLGLEYSPVSFGFRTHCLD